MTRLLLEHVSKTYDGTQKVLDDITLNVEPGELLVIVGPSGCGKSTLLRLIAGLEPLSNGEIYFDDQPVSFLPPQQRDVGMVFQNYALYPHMTVAENLAFPLRVRRIPKAQQRERVHHVAKLLDLEPLLNRLPRQLSGGQQQRVAVGRALVRSPRVFLFDEPLSNLDAQLRLYMRSELAALQRRLGITTLYVTHDHSEAMTMGDRIALLYSGCLLQIGTSWQLYHDPDDLQVASFFGTPPINLLKGTVHLQSTGIYFCEQNDSFHMTLPSEVLRNGNLSEQAIPVTLGVRAEHVCLARTDNADCTAYIERVEFAGHESIAMICVGALRLSMRPSIDVLLRQGEKIPIRFERAAVMLFDSTAGKRL